MKIAVDAVVVPWFFAFAPRTTSQWKCCVDGKSILVVEFLKSNVKINNELLNWNEIHDSEIEF